MPTTSPEAIATLVSERLGNLSDLKAKSKQAAKDASPQAIALAFDNLAHLDANKDQLTTLAPAIHWGFAAHDSRFLRDLADQTKGQAKHSEAKPLTRRQLDAVRLTLQREPYLTQVALTTT